MPVLESRGFCPVCEEDSNFLSEHAWLRDHFICTRCWSIPRERALADVIRRIFPHYKELSIHESSPANRGLSEHLRQTCPGYTSSHYHPDIPHGDIHPAYGHRCEDIEDLTFADGSFDLFITQDVLEHIFDPSAAFREIGRTLRPGGAHIFTVPIMCGRNPSHTRAVIDEHGQVQHLAPPEYHENPSSSDNKSLVTTYWGYDIVHHIYRASALITTVYQIDDLSKGIRAEFNDVFASVKA
ncbi:MAG: class I SAM-dependent methyltransferase [Rhodocyclaceae bacterium]